MSAQIHTLETYKHVLLVKIAHLIKRLAKSVKQLLNGSQKNQIVFSLGIWYYNVKKWFVGQSILIL